MNDLAAAIVNFNFTKEICLGWPFILLFISFNITNRDKVSSNRKKLASNNKPGKLKVKSSANKKQLANDNYGEPDNKPSVDMESLVVKKNIDQDTNIDV